MRQFAIAVIMLALVSVSVALVGIPYEAPATAAQSSDVPLDANPEFQQVKPAPGDGTGSDTGVYFPAVSSSHSEITGSVVGEQSGPQGFFVGTVDAQGHKKFWHGLTDANGHLHFLVPSIVGLTGLFLFTHFDKRGQPDVGSDCKVTDGPVHLPGGQALANIPVSGPAITEGYSAYELGGKNQSVLQMLTRSGDPLQEKMLLNGSDRNIDTLASSDRALVGKLHDATQPGFYRTSFTSGSKRSNDMPTSIVRVTFDPLPPLKTGQTVPVRMHIEGIRPQDQAVVVFTVGGAATVADGSTTTTVPVKDGLAEILIRGVRPGGLEVATDLEVHQPEGATVSETTPPPSPTKYPYYTTSRPTPTPRAPFTSTPTPKPNGGSTETRETPPPGTEGRNTPIPEPSTTTRETPTPPPTEHPSPTPYPTPTPTPTPCEIRPWDGWFEPEQAVWQDDSTWKDKPPPHLVRVSDDVPHYKAELNMVTDKPAVLFGVDWYVNERGDIRELSSRDTIVIELYTDCTTKIPVRMKFTGESGVVRTVIYTSGVLDEVPLKPPAGAWQHVTVKLPAPTGIPETSTFTFLPDTDYRIVDQLIDDSGAPIDDAKVIVDGHAEVTHGPVIRYVPLLLSHDSSFYNAATKRDLTLRTVAIMQDAHKYIPDFYPVKPWDLPSITRELVDFNGKDLSQDWQDAFKGWAARKLNAASEADIQAKTLANQRQKLDAAITDYLQTSGIIDGAGRTIAIMSDHDYFSIAPANSLGITETTKLILIPEFMNFQTVGHELTHSIPAAVWSSPQMQSECGLDYHNTENLIANGERITTASVLAARVREDKTFPLMGASGKGPSPNTAIPANWPLPVADRSGKVDPEKWITECTYWHLLKTLTVQVDPQVLLVRGIQYRYGKFNAAALGSFYTLDGHADLVAGRPADYEIIAYDGNGTALATYPFTPIWRLPDINEDRDLIAFGYRIPITADVARVDVVGPGAAVLASKTLSAHAPAIRITQPAGSAAVQVHNGSVHVAWTSQPSTPSDLASVLYSSDGGTTWIDQVFETKATSFDVTVAPHTHKHQVKIVVTDGTRSASQVLRFTTP